MKTRLILGLVLVVGCDSSPRQTPTEYTYAWKDSTNLETHEVRVRVDTARMQVRLLHGTELLVLPQKEVHSIDIIVESKCEIFDTTHWACTLYTAFPQVKLAPDFRSWSASDSSLMYLQSYSIAVNRTYTMVRPRVSSKWKRFLSILKE